MCICNLSSHSTVKSSAAAAKGADFEVAADQAQWRRPPTCWNQHESTPLLLADVEDMTAGDCYAGCTALCEEIRHRRKGGILRHGPADLIRMCYRVSLRESRHCLTKHIK